jgi:hypothetical protein
VGSRDTGGSQVHLMVDKGPSPELIAKMRAAGMNVPEGPDYENPYRNIPDDYLTDGEKKVIEEMAKESMGANSRQEGGRHYKKVATPCPHCGQKIEHWDLAWAASWDFFQYNITKYLFRWRHKGGVLDLKKAAHHLQKYIEVATRE